MEIILFNLKEKYNKLLQREKNAEIYFSNPLVEQSKKDACMEEFLKITRGLSKMTQTYKEITGREMTSEEVLNGIE